ncbi:hypothetical protein LX36DRAFT_471899 [Colletotrichum falcatum]|nr:hypothetical protein LX36DRAFT_471899 [Colletotrichum falcatum]
MTAADNNTDCPVCFLLFVHVPLSEHPWLPAWPLPRVSFFLLAPRLSSRLSWQSSLPVAHGGELSPCLAPAHSLGCYSCLDSRQSCFFPTHHILSLARSLRLLNVSFGRSSEFHPSSSFLACPTVLFPLVLKCLWRLQYLALIKLGLGASAPSLRNSISRPPFQPARGMHLPTDPCSR